MKLKTKQGAKEGETRMVSGFLWLPKCIDGEWRWLEQARQKQTVKRLTQLIPEGGCYSPSQTYLKWVADEWV